MFRETYSSVCSGWKERILAIQPGWIVGIIGAFMFLLSKCFFSMNMFHVFSQWTWICVRFPATSDLTGIFSLEENCVSADEWAVRTNFVQMCSFDMFRSIGWVTECFGTVRVFTGVRLFAYTIVCMSLDRKKEYLYEIVRVIGDILLVWSFSCSRDVYIERVDLVCELSSEEITNRAI